MPYSPAKQQEAIDFRGVKASPNDRIVSAIPSKFTTAPEMRVGIIDEFLVNDKGDNFMRVKWVYSTRPYSSTQSSVISVEKNTWMRLNEHVAHVENISPERIESEVFAFLRASTEPVLRQEVYNHFSAIYPGRVNVPHTITEMFYITRKLVVNSHGYVAINV